MNLSLPESNDISVEIEGVNYEGSWSNILGDLVVYFHGFTTSVSFPDQPDDVAEKLLRELVEKHHIPIDAIPDSIPKPIRLVAYRFINADMEDDETETERLIEVFGESPVGSIVHLQLSWLCVNALSMIVPAWRLMCDDDTAEPAYVAMRGKLIDSSEVIDLDTLAVPMIARRNGLQVADCDACRLEPIAEAIAQTAAFMKQGHASNAIAAILAASSAYAEGCHSANAPDRFSQWLCIKALRQSIDCEPITAPS